MIILGVKSFILSLSENVLSRSRFIPGRDLVQHTCNRINANAMTLRKGFSIAAAGGVLGARLRNRCDTFKVYDNKLHTLEY
jgi:hypothetical protein